LKTNTFHLPGLTLLIASSLLLASCNLLPSISTPLPPTGTNPPPSPTSLPPTGTLPLTGTLPPTSTQSPSATSLPSQTPAENQVTPTVVNAQIEPGNADRLEPVASLDQAGARLFTWLPEPAPNASTIAVSNGQAVTLLNQRENSLIESASLSNADAAILTAAPVNELVAWASQDNSIHVWSQSQNRELFNLPGSETAITSLVFSPDGKTLAFAAYDNSVSLLNASDGESISSYAFDSWLSDLAFSPDNRLLAGVDLPNFVIHIWEIASGNEIRTLQWTDQASPALYGAFFSPDWTQVAWVARGTVQLMDIASGKPGLVLEHEDFVNDVSWSPDSKLLASAAAGTLNGDFVPLIEVWDAGKGQSIKTLGQQAPIFNLAFSPDGSLLGALDGDGKLQLFGLAPQR
jgi:WD40 repeat protein